MENLRSIAVITVLYVLHHVDADMDTKEIFRDDFIASSLNTSIWSVAQGPAAFRNKFISLNAKNVGIDQKNNWLCLNAVADEKPPNYMQSGMIYTKGKFDFKYGELIVRARVARGQSIWSMVQLISSTCSPQMNNCPLEIGAVAVNGGQAKLFHTRAVFKDVTDKPRNYSNAYDSGKQLTLEFRNYRLIWANGHIVWFIDDVNVANYTIFDMDKWPNMQIVISAINDPDDPSPTSSPPTGFCIDSVVIHQHVDKPKTPILKPVVQPISVPLTSAKTIVNDTGSLPLAVAVTASTAIPLIIARTNESLPSVSETTISDRSVDYTSTSANTTMIMPVVSSKVGPAVLGTIIPVAVILCVALSVYWLVRHRKRQLKGSQMRRATIKNFYSRSKAGSTLIDRSVSSSVAETVIMVPALENYVNLLEIPLAKLQITDTVLGRGNFGLVRKGVATDLRGQLGPTEVAVKSLKVLSDPEQVKQLTQELKVMAKAGRHLNILNLLGVVTKGEVLLLLEYAKYGSLIKYLQSYPGSRYYNQVGLHGEILPYNEDAADRIAKASTEIQDPEHGSQILSTRTLLNFSFQISRGMEYLYRRSIIHRDLAARNVLICDGYVAKISDFGMARQQAEYVLLDPNATVPIRWMSPEAIIERMFSHKSDVWAFGIVLWEIFTLGALPYADVDMHQHGYDFIASLKNGFRLDKPIACPAVIFDLMSDCWKLHPDDRLDFARLTDNLRQIVDKDADQTYLRLDFGYELFNSEYQNLIDEIRDDTRDLSNSGASAF